MTALKRWGFNWQNWDMKTGYKPIQWRSTVTAPSCAFCNKAVYPAEEVMGAGQKFHKFCLKCTSCNTLLNTGNLNVHEKKIYCVSCYRRQFGPRELSRGLRTSFSLNADTPSASPRLNEIKPKVDYHRKTSIGSSPSHTSSDDDTHYSSNPYIHKVTYLNGVTLQQINSRSTLTTLPSFKIISISANICPRCSKSVYLAEEVKAAGKSFHQRCYTCANCKGSISGARYSEHNGELYDNNCYLRLFGPKGRLLRSI